MRYALFTILGFCALVSLPVMGQEAPSRAEALKEAADLMKDQMFKEAVLSFERADSLAGGSCLPCQVGLAQAFEALGDFKKALKSAEAALRLADNNAALATAYHLQGSALFALAGDDPDLLERAEKAFRQALEKTQGRSNKDRFKLAGTLLRRGRDSEGTALLKEYLLREPQGPYSQEARVLIANPERARKRMVPTFRLRTLDGGSVSSSQLGGKVVLLEFWASWCLPCERAMPDLKIIARRWEEDPFVFMGISMDRKEAPMRGFLKRHKVFWPQVWDKDSAFASMCGVKEIPTYVLIDHTGEIIYTTSGWSSRTGRTLRGKVQAALRTARKSTEAKAGEL